MKTAEEIFNYQKQNMLRSTGDMVLDGRLGNALAELEMQFDDKDISGKYLPVVVVDMIWARALPALIAAQKLFAETWQRAEESLPKFQAVLDRKLDPVKELSEMQQLQAQMKEQETRSMLHKMDAGQRRQIIEQALQKDDSSLLTAWLGAPVPAYDCVELRLVKNEYDKQKAQSICQLEYTQCEENKAYVQTVKTAVNLGRGHIAHIVNGQWKALNSAKREELLKNPEFAAAIQETSAPLRF